MNCASLGLRDEYSRHHRHSEAGLEAQVSRAIAAMPVIWLSIPDEPGPDSDRGFIERNAIALLSNHSKEALDPPRSGWLGRHCDRGSKIPWL